MYKRLIGSAALAVSLFLLPGSAMAAEFRLPQTGGEGDLTIAEGETVQDDLYVVGGKIRISGTVTGDVFVAGGEISIDGAIEGSLNVAGGQIAVDGPVGGSVRIVGGQAKVGDGAKIGKDLIFLGGTLDLSSGSSVGRDLVMTGGQLSSAGSVARNMLMRGGDASVSGAVGGWSDIGADSLALAGTSKIGGDLTVRTPADPEVMDGATVGGEYRKIAVEKPRPSMAGIAMRGFWKAITLFLLALFLVLVFEKKTAAVVHDFRGKVGRNALYGLAAFFMTVPAAVLLLISMIGAPFAVGLVFVWLIALYVSAAYLAIWVGQLIRKTFMKDKPLGWYDAAIGAAALWIAAMVPVLGWLVEVSFLIYALGVLVSVELEVLKLVRKTDMIQHA